MQPWLLNVIPISAVTRRQCQLLLAACDVGSISMLRYDAIGTASTLQTNSSCDVPGKVAVLLCCSAVHAGSSAPCLATCHSYHLLDISNCNLLLHTYMEFDSHCQDKGLTEEATLVTSLGTLTPTTMYHVES